MIFAEVPLLKKGQFKQSDKGTYFIQIRESKTRAGIREVPIPAKLMQIGLADFIKGKEPHQQIFRYKEGNALGKKFARHIKDVAKIDRGRLVLHSLRKFLNDLMMKNGVSLEARCQFIGHEIENVNVVTYANKFNVDELAEKTSGVIRKVLNFITHPPTP
jgi:integrase